jgi:hypothetical protein
VKSGTRQYYNTGFIPFVFNPIGDLCIFVVWAMLHRCCGER